MAGISTFLKEAFLAQLGGDPYTPPTGTVFALYSVAPTDLGGGIELTGNGYVRQPISWGSPVVDGSGNVTISNNAVISFPQATGNWVAIIAGGIWDTAGSPNFLWWGACNPSANINLGDMFQIPQGGLTLSLS